MKFILVIAVLFPFLAHASLYKAYEDYFDIGVAVSGKQIFKDDKVKLVNEHFNSVTAEYTMKWNFVEVEPSVYDFSWIDSFVDYAKNNNKNVIGHTLVWHRINPSWLFTNTEGEPKTRDQLLQQLESHINTYMGRYRGQVKGWDVVNEAFNFDGTYRNTPWFEIIGEDYIEKAFEFAHQADPRAELYYNDYGLVNKDKQDAVIKMIRNLQAKGIPIHGVGIQGHYSLNFPELELLDKAIARFSELGIQVMITELDVSVLPFPGPEERGEDAEIQPARLQQLDPYDQGLPTNVMQQLTDRYVDLFCIFLKHHETVSRVTFWGITDKLSWRNNWPVKGRTDYPLLYDRNVHPKPAVSKLIELADIYLHECGHVWIEKE